MRGYRIIGLTEKGVDALKKNKAGDKDRLADVSVTCQDPYTVSVLFKKRYRIVNFVKEDVINLWAQRSMPFCSKGVDYDIEVLE